MSILFDIKELKRRLEGEKLYQFKQFKVTESLNSLRIEFNTRKKKNKRHIFGVKHDNEAIYLWQLQYVDNTLFEVLVAGVDKLEHIRLSATPCYRYGDMARSMLASMKDFIEEEEEDEKLPTVKIPNVALELDF